MLKKQDFTYYLGWLTLSFLGISIISGVALLFRYDPTTFQKAQDSMFLISDAYSFGWLIRSAHFYSSELFFIFLIIHTVWHVYLEDYKDKKYVYWLALVAIIVIAFFEMFTGFVLKANNEGDFASLIMQHIILSTPFFGQYIVGLFYSQEYPSIYFYFYHICILPFVLILLNYYHIKRMFTSFENTLIAFFATIFLSVFFSLSAPYDVVSSAKHPIIWGPWFFWSIQWSLFYIAPFIAGIILPILGLSTLALLPNQKFYFLKRVFLVGIVLYFIIIFYIMLFR
ncbi:Cytochrome b6-f complex subunit, cytochrome b6 [Desulfurella amilsii]|uniref:Cytochrome b6-f complex subunit, cytochrome b6 n=1 Tax=Desulfurella amilsii TaxID=1562698 RepID=A0A1X4XXK9_9BACT|nr:cytochrome b N-terminal domain-containing protein [Desulfurella amilsii]OSS42248.1 Cytochrome b6-f complex subunit, cytochrome b6 [Desulfurella amilsii]